MYNTEMKLKSNILITTFLDEKWTAVLLEFNNTSIQVIREEIDKKTTKKSVSLLFELHLHTIHSIVKDPDNFMLQLDSKSKHFDTTGYYTFKMNSRIDFASMVGYLEMYKHINWTFRTKEQDTV